MFRNFALALLFSIAAADKDPVLRGYHHSNRELKITVTNLSYQQPLGPFFVAVHNEEAVPLFKVGQPASEALRTLAEEGSPVDLISYYSNEAPQGILSAEAFNNGMSPPLLGTGEEFSFNVTVNNDFPYVSMASMAVNTNDCFAGISGMKFRQSTTITAPGYDSGTENNDESCDYVPGPACMGQGAGQSAGPGEGVVHVHRGIHGIGDLAADIYDWRNPMLQITVEMA